MSREELADASLVLISHSHWDHLDAAFLRTITAATPVVVPDRAVSFVHKCGAGNVTGVSAWRAISFGGIAVTVVPAIHIAPSVGYVIQADGSSVYFSGDTYYSSFMHEVSRRFRLDVAILPVARYALPMTLGVSGAVRAVRALKPTVVIPMHHMGWFGSRVAAGEGTQRRFLACLQQAGVSTKAVILQSGQSWLPD